MTKLDKTKQELTMYAELEGSEIGNACLKLIEFSEFAPKLSDSFARIVNEEMSIMLDYFKENTRIVELKGNFPPFKIRDLEWIGEEQ